MFPPGSSFTLPVQKDTKVFDLSGVNSALRGDQRASDLTLEIINLSVSPVEYPTATPAEKSSHSASSHYSDGTKDKKKNNLDFKQNLPIPISVGFTLYPNAGGMYNLEFHKALPCQIFCKEPELQALMRFAV